MLTFLVRRVVYSMVLIFFSLSLTFVIVSAIPTNPFDRMRAEMAERKTPAAMAQISPEHWQRLENLVGFNKPLGERYLEWIREAYTGDLGFSWSIAWGQDVFQLIMARLPYTLMLIAAASFLALIISLPLGLYSAVRPYSNGDVVFMLLSFGGLAMPSFLTGLFLLIVFSNSLGWLPYSGASSPGQSGDLVTLIIRLFTLGQTNAKIAGREGEVFIDGVKHLLLPSITLAVFLVARWNRLLKNALLDALHQDYIRTALAKGMRPWAVALKHALPNAFIPAITIAALDIPMLFTGSFMTEIVFSWPGIGRLYIDSFRFGDWPTLMGVIVFSTYLIVLANLLADLAYGIVDPRIRQAR